MWVGNHLDIKLAFIVLLCLGSRTGRNTSKLIYVILFSMSLDGQDLSRLNTCWACWHTLFISSGGSL